MKKIRFFSAAMAAAMLLSLLPVSALAAEEPEHLVECGYVCTHVHSEECGFYVHTSETVPCDHADDCGYVAEDVYGTCDCAAEADDEGTLVHSDACASLKVVTAAAPCGHADGDAKDTVTETPDACTHTCGDDEWVCVEGCPVANQNAEEDIVGVIAKAAEAEPLTLDINNGSVSVEKSGGDLLVVQGETHYTLTDGALTLTGTVVSKAKAPKSAVEIGSDVELTLITTDLNIEMAYSNAHIINIGSGAQVDWELKGTATLNASNASCVRLNTGTALTIRGEGTLNGINELVGSAVITVPHDANLTIDGATVSVEGGGAGIGSDSNHGNPSIESWAGNIEIVGGAHVTAKGGNQSAAIGGGQYSNGGSIHIGGGSVVDATSGGNGPAAIGGGQRATGATGGKAGTIVIDGSSTVIARGTSGASAIGRGLDAANNVIPDSTSSITIEKGAHVTAYALGHDNYTGEHGKPYYFAIDAGITNNGDAPILNARFDKGALPKKRVIDKSDPSNPVSVPQFNNIIVMGGEKDISLALPAESPVSAFATTVSGAGSYMVANAEEGKAAERAQYLPENGDSQFLFTVGEGMTTRNQLKFASYAITASAGENGSISDVGETAVSPLGGKTYTFSPATGYVVDTVTVDSAPVSVTGNTYTFENLTENHTIAVTFKTAPVGPVDPPVDPGVTTYTVTVKYVDMAGKGIAPDYTVRQDAGSSYDVSAQAAKTIAGYTKDHVDGAETGTVRGNVTVTVYYAAVTDNKPEEPGTEIPDEETPKTDLPETEIPGEEVPTAPGPEDTVIVDPEVPMGNLPQTGAVLYTERPVAVGVGALALSLLLAGMAIGLKKRKDEKNT